MRNVHVIPSLAEVFPETADPELTEGFSCILKPAGTSIKRNATTGKFEMHPPPAATATPTIAATSEAGPSTSAAVSSEAVPAPSATTDESAPLDISNLTPREVAAQAALRRSARLNKTPSPSPPPPAPTRPPVTQSAATAPTEIPLPDSPILEATSLATASPTTAILTSSDADLLTAELDKPIDSPVDPDVLETSATSTSPSARLPTLTPLYSPDYESGLPHPHPQPLAPLPAAEPNEDATMRRRLEEALERLESLERELKGVRELLAGGDGRGKGKGKDPAEGPRFAVA
jgi:hypothetical protein